MASLSECPPPQSKPNPQIENPSSPPQNSQTLTLENTPPQPQNQQDEDDPLVLDQDPDHQSSNRTLTSPSQSHSRRSQTRKKGAHYKKKQAAIEKKVQTLIQTLNPIPFSPSKSLDFNRHEELLKQLELWEFVNIKFDRTIHTDLIAQLIVNYESKPRCSYVNGYRINVNRPSLGRALKLPMRREKGGGATQEAVVVDLDKYDLEVNGFIENLVSNWMLLHGEVWCLPSELMSWTKEIKNGHPEKVDWAGMVWFMVEKELSQGVKLNDCYYASHLQYLIKSQKGELFDLEEPEVEVREEEPNVELTLGQENADKEEAKDGEESKEMDMDVDMMVVDESKDDAVVEGDWKAPMGEPLLQRCNLKKDTVMDSDEESKDDVAQGDLALDVKSSTGAHFLQPCDMNEDTVMEGKLEEDGERNIEEEGGRSFEEGERAFIGEEEDEMKLEDEEGERTFIGEEEDEIKLEEEDEIKLEEEDEIKLEEEDEIKIEEEDEGEDEEEDDREFSLTPKVHTMGRDGYGGNFLQGIDTNHVSYGQFDDHSNMGNLSPRAEPYTSSDGFFGNGFKREISHGYDLLDTPCGGSNKRLRTDGSSSKSSDYDFNMCMDQIQLWMGKAKEKHEAKEKYVEELSKNQQILIAEVQQRDNMIDHLHKIKYEELQKKDEEICRVDRELFVMSNLVKGYRDALKARDKNFAEYRQRCQLPEEPIYKDVGPGGLVLSTMEIERQRLKKEEEDKVNRVIIEQNIKQFEEEFVVTFEGYINQLQMMDAKLLDLEKEVSQLKKVSAEGIVSEKVDSAAATE